MMSGRLKAAAGLLVLAATAGCGSTSSSTSTSPLIPTTFFPTGVTAFISSVQTVSAPAATATSQTGHPATSAGGSALQVSAPSSISSNGADIVTLHDDTPFQKVIVSVTNASAEVDGFYTLTLPSATTDATILVKFVTALPVPAFSLGFRPVTAGGSIGPVAPLATTVATDLTSLSPTIVTSYSPSPAPFLNGANCAFSTQLGCLWEFKVLIQEFNGVSVPTATLTETYTFNDGTVTTNSLPIIIPGFGTATILRTTACGSPTTSCIPASEMSGGTYTYSVTGADVNGKPFSITGPTLVLLGK
jgi:hypothetical protein